MTGAELSVLPARQLMAPSMMGRTVETRSLCRASLGSFVEHGHTLY